MLASLDYPIRDLLIIDNGGKFEDVFAKDELPVKNFHVLMMPTNLGVAASWNLGIKSFPHADRWFFASNDMTYRPGDLELLATSKPTSLTLSTHYPSWHTYVLGEQVVDRVGLFDERFMPAYFEDTDYLRRVQLAGLPVTKLDVAPHHDNSSTINSDARYQAKNQQTFQRNKTLHLRKSAGNDPGWSWTLRDCRAGEWGRVD